MESKLLIIAVIILGVIAVTRLMKVYDLSSKLGNKNEAEISERHNRLNANLLLLFCASLFIGFLWLIVHFGWSGRGPAASAHGHGLDVLYNVNFAIVLFVFFLTHIFLFYFAFKYVRKPGVKAYYFTHSNKLEVIWTAVPAVVLFIIIIFGLRSWNTITDDAAPEAIRLELFSKQFDWTARYSGTDNRLGKFDYKLTTDNNELALLTTNTIDSAIQNMDYGINGIHDLEAKLNNPELVVSAKERSDMMTTLDRKGRLIRLLHQMKGRHDSKNDAYAWDDIIQKDTLYLCKGTPYELSFRSKDVIHSAYFPEFRVQMNTVPGFPTRFKFTPDITTKEYQDANKDSDFNFALLCNKICGGSHYKMKMAVVVLSPVEYKAWMKTKSLATFKDKYFAKAE
ncbi:MAG: cytochrome c oxidase subunit II [Flavobacteriales bacterium]|nr:cytochrome c oxidase subunit II [Flavobacteriales bacterium]